MKEKRAALIIAFMAMFISIATLVVYFNGRQKTGFILISDVYNEFELKKEMEVKYTTTRNARKKILDSLQIDLSVLAHQLKNAKSSAGTGPLLFERRRVEYEHKAQQFDEDNAQLSQQYDAQIVKQLNQYVSDFGKEQHYDIIFGNTTTGSVMYGTEKLNLTREVIQYVNNKYKGIR